MRAPYVTAALAALASSAVPAVAQDMPFYLSGSIGGAFLSESDNDAALTSPLPVTGTGTALDGATLPSGTPIGWRTEFDDAMTFSLAVGRIWGAFRIETELAFADHDVDGHFEIDAGGIDLTAVDAAVLDPAQTTPTGTTVGALIAEGRGSLEATYLFANGYWDFEIENTPITPYIGAGLGAAFVNLDYRPSGVVLLDADETVFAWQVMAGASYAPRERVNLFAEVTYRGTSDIEADSPTLPAEISVENESVSAEIGVRVDFGGV